MRVPRLQLLARLEQPAMDVPEERAGAIHSRLEALPAALVDHHLVGEASQLQALLFIEAVGADQAAQPEAEGPEDELLEPVVHEEGEPDEAAALLAVVAGKREDKRL